ncbi:hypothetical protein HYH03_008005 [Edaphochlamys debaryana]|uniref:Uncharacterized protein n=1 Tax=Edaphochlamys debaryana TaxID=47281 RepID=A0A835Y109_9CHLO|nr:hypothetical protein HYH03_008005 [Edaphochlamys debaryana]|eukprot:KAG2493785.1 hypothetical protein HYH03_008005 [Edaphochlamys debaryana]
MPRHGSGRSSGLPPLPGGGGVTRQRYKVTVLGAAQAGKTALVRRLAEGCFPDQARVARGLDFYTCHVPLRDDIAVTLQLWDVSDCPTRPEDDPTPLAAYIFNSQAILLVYDVSVPESLAALRFALAAVDSALEASAGFAPRPYLALFGCKADLPWQASEQTARELAARHGAVRFSVSALSGEGIDEAALQIACDLAGVPFTATDAGRRLGAAPGPAGRLDPEQERALLGLGPGPGVVADGRAQDAAPDGGSRLASRSGSGMGSDAWRPVSRSSANSSTAMLISKAGLFGQKPVPPRSTSPLAISAAGPAAAVVAGAAMGSTPEEPGFADLAGSKEGKGRAGTEDIAGGKGGGWRTLCCCFGGS